MHLETNDRIPTDAARRREIIEPPVETTGAATMDHDLWLEDTRESSKVGWSLEDGGARHECMAWLPKALVKQKLTGFASDRGASIVETSESGLRARLEAGQIEPAEGDHNFALELEVRLHRTTNCVKSMTHVSLLMRPLADGIATEALHRHYTQLIRDFRACLMAEHLERRFADRFDAQFPVEVWADDGSRSKAVGTAKNVSSTGVAVLLSQEPRTRNVFVRYHDRATEDVVCARAHVVRIQPEGDEASLCGIRLDRVSRIRQWDERADAPDLAALGKWDPRWDGMNDAPRCDGAHASPASRPYFADHADRPTPGTSNLSDELTADVQQLVSRQRKLNEELAHLEGRLRQSNAACDVLERWWSQDAAHETCRGPRLRARFTSLFSRKRRRAEDRGLPSATSAPRPDGAKDSAGPLGRSVDAAASRAMLTAGATALREVANTAMHDDRQGQQRRRTFAYVAVILLVATAVTGGLALSGVFGDPTPLLAALEQFVRTVELATDRFYPPFSAL